LRTILVASIDYCYERGWIDGLRVAPPIVDRMDAMLTVDDRQ
jgi:hypothetical protein